MSLAYLERQAVKCGRPACGAQIVFGITEAGRPMPLDLLPDRAGNVAVYVDGSGRIRARVVSADLPCASHEQLHLPHFATCGKATSTKGQVVVPLYKARAWRNR